MNLSTNPIIFGNRFFPVVYLEGYQWDNVPWKRLSQTHKLRWMIDRPVSNAIFTDTQTNVGKTIYFQQLIILYKMFRLTRIWCIYVKFAWGRAGLGKVVGVWIGIQDVHVQFEATIRYAGLQRRWERWRVKCHQHFLPTKRVDREQMFFFH